MSSASHTIEGHINTALPQPVTEPFATPAPERAKRKEFESGATIKEETSDLSSSAEGATPAAIESGIESEGVKIERVVEYCADPEQAVTNYRLVGVVGLMVVVMLTQTIFCLMLYLRRPDRIVVDRTRGGDRVVVMNDREYGLTDSVEFTRDAPTEGDKKYLASRYLELLFGNNPDRRDRQLEQAIRLMTPANGRRFFNYLRDNRILQQQAAESWQAVWTPQSITVDSNDPFTVRAIGIQRLTRIVGGASREETRQLNVVVKLNRDELGRDDRNLRTGYLVDWFDWNELRDPAAQAPSASSAR